MRSTKPDIAQKFKYITPQISFYKLLQKQREVGKKNLSQESHGGNVVRSVKFLFSALPHSLSKPFLFWKVPHTGAPRDPPAVLVARGSHCITFSCSWPSPASGLLQTGLQLGSLHTPKWTQRSLQEAYPVMPTETKHFILPEHAEIQRAADMDEMANSANWYRTHHHTRHSPWGYYTSLACQRSPPSEHSLCLPLVHPHLKATFSCFVDSFQTPLDSHFSLFTPINMLVWSWRCISMRSRVESWHWNVYIFISYTHVCMYVCATVHSCSIVSYSLQSQVL